MSDQKKVAKKSGRVKRSRLGRGLSALVDVPVVVEAGGVESDNLIGNKERSVSQQGSGGGVVGDEGGGSSGVGSGGGGGESGGLRGGGDGGGDVNLGTGGAGGIAGAGDGGVAGTGGAAVAGAGEGVGGVGGRFVGDGGVVEDLTVPSTASRGTRDGGRVRRGEGEEVRRQGALTPALSQEEKITGGAREPRGEIEVVGGGGVVGDGGVVEIGVGLIGVNRDQPRRVFDEGALSALAGSILEHGLMQPVVVRRKKKLVEVGEKKEKSEGGREAGRVGSPHPGPLPSELEREEEGIRYELIAGERRWRASMLAGLETIRAIVRDVDDETSAQLALIENVQREDLNVVELAEGYRVLSDRYCMTQERIAKVVGVSRSSVANTVRILDLPNEVRDLIVGGKLTSGHGKVLLSLGVPEKQRKFAARCLKEGWNVRQLQRACDDAVDGGGGSDVQSKVGKNPEEDRALSVLRDLEKRVGEELGTRVKIRTDKSRTRGRVVIEFFDLDQFDGLLGRLGVKIDG